MGGTRVFFYIRKKVTVMSCTHKLRGIFRGVGCEMSLVGGTDDF